MKTIKVAEVFDSEGVLSAILPENATMEEVVAKLSLEPQLRGVFLVDGKQRFAGIITRTDLLKWAHLKLGTRPNIADMPVREVFRLVYSTKARDLARGDWKTIGVKLTDDLGKALGQLLENDLIDVPVLDEDGRILGDLKLSHVLLKALEVGKQTSSD